MIYRIRCNDIWHDNETNSDNQLMTSDNQLMISDNQLIMLINNNNNDDNQLG